MAEEMRQHLDELTRSYAADGMEPGEARLAAQKRFGGVTQIEERCRDERGFIWLGQISNDVRYALRSLARARGFTLTVLLTLVLGIGVTTAVFSLTATDLFLALPFPSPHQLVRIGLKDQLNGDEFYIPRFVFQADSEQARCFEEIAAVERHSANVVISGEPAGTPVLEVSADCFHTLGIAPALGRGFLPEEHRTGSNNVAVISYLFWQRHFDGSRDVLGRQILIDGQMCSVVGVLAADQRFPPIFGGDLYHPLVLRVDPQNIFLPMLSVIGRLKSGVSREQALAEISAVRLPELPQWAADYMSRLKPIVVGLADLARPDSSWVMLIAGLFLYAISCLNAMNLMLIRLLRRRRELSIRFAVGGSRGQVVRLVAIESLMLTLAASVIVAFIARWVFPPLFALVNGNEAELFYNHWDWATLTCVAGLSCGACLLTVFVPALRLLKAEVNSGLKDGGPTLGECRASGRIRNSLVSVQAAFAVLLLIGTGLMVQSFEKLRRLDLGFDPIGKVRVQVSFPKGLDLAPEAHLQLFQKLQQRLGAIPGVRNVSYGQDSLLVGYFEGSAQLQMADGSFAPVTGTFVASDFATTAGLVLKKGRWLSGKRGEVEAVVNEAFAKARFGDRDPIGLSFKIKVAGDQQFPVVGVIRDVKDTVRSSTGMHFYTADWVYPKNINSLVLRLNADPKKEFAGLVRRAIYEVEPRLIVESVNSIDEMVQNSMWAEHYAFMILKGLSMIAFGLTVVGLFAVIAYTVDSRISEFGIRIALGATPSALHRLVMFRGLSAAAIGLGFGTLAAVGLTRFMKSLLFETTPYDPLVYLGVSVVLLFAGVAACWLPARRATRVDVARLLRSD